MSDRDVGAMLLNFGEPERPTMADVVPFLERIFLTNASLEAHATPEQALERSRELARRRAPGLIEEYELIGGSPMNAQIRENAAALEAELTRRGRGIRVYAGTQFTDPLIADVAARARADGVRRLVAVPAYPLCGPSTTVAALRSLEAAVGELGWDVELLEVSGWHRHPDYAAVRADGIRRTAAGAGVRFDDAETRLVFSAHGTPLKYLEEGSRYDRYVEQSCAAVAAALGVETYDIGWQNHANRGIAWTQPDVEALVRGLPEQGVARIVVVPISFLYEQSETLAELDHELRDEAAAVGLEFHRVPVPHGDARVAGILADLVEARLDGDAGVVALRRCRCHADERARCTNAGEPAGAA